MQLYEISPAEKFADAHLLGNGRIGASIYGEVPDGRILLNEDTFWSGSEEVKGNPSAKENFATARRLALEGKYGESADVIEQSMLGKWTESYQPIGFLQISHAPGDPGTSDHLWRRQGLAYDNYRRTLSLAEALETVEYSFQGHHYKHEYFVSHPAQIVAAKISSASGKLNLNISFESEIRHGIQVAGDKLLVTGRAPDHVEPNYTSEKPSVVYLADEHSKSIRFASLVRVLETDGTVTEDSRRIGIRGASFVVVAVSVRTNYAGYKNERNNDISAVVNRCENDLLAVEKASFDDLKREHIDDYRSLYERAVLDIQPAVVPGMPTSERMAIAGRLQDPSLMALALQYSRYLLISSSRPGTQAANLQGIWNPEVRPPWSSNYTTNINVQMNYWPAEVLNLSDCHLPMCDFVSEVADNGRWVADHYYGMKGWSCSHNADLWRSANPVGGLASWAFWPVGGGWLCQHLWQHYAFTGDREFLRDVAYPVLMGAAEFFLDYLVEDDEGYLSTAPSNSPENNFFLAEFEDIDEDVIRQISARNRMAGSKRTTAPICKSSAMDMAIARELFGNCLKAGEILGEDSSMHEKMRESLERLYPFKIGRHGQLQEWSEDFAECTPGMGHVSHMYGLHPSNLFTPEKEPQLYEACRKSMMRRLNHGGMKGHWPGAWAINLFARLKERFVCSLLADSVFDGLGHNMLTDGHHQIDCVFGIGAGVAEMLIQSHAGYIELIPALPSSWTAGSFSGFKAQGGFEVSCSWEGGSATAVSVKSLLGGVCRVRCSGVTSVESNGQAVEFERLDSGAFAFPTDAGKTYELNMG